MIPATFAPPFRAILLLGLVLVCLCRPLPIGCRPAALGQIGAALDEAVLTAVPKLEAILDSETASIVDVPLPASLGPVCSACGCSQNDACGFGCSWATADLCSACVGRAAS